MPDSLTKLKRPGQARGLPATFGLDAPLGARKPVQLGDYLDDDSREPEPATEEPTPEPEPVVEQAKPMPRPAKKRGGGGPATSLPNSARSRFVRNGPPRKQINMRPETLDRARELLWLVQEYGPQPDAKASEMFEALVDLLWDARGKLDLRDVPLRGKWGETSAREFPQHLKHAFAAAIVDDQAKPGGDRLAKLAA